MNARKFAVFGAVVVLGGAISSVGAYASDSATSQTWQGPYGGFALGGVYGKSSPSTTVTDGTYFQTGNISKLNDTLQNSIEGAALSGSLLLGYNFQRGNVVYGVDADLTAMNFSESERNGPVGYPVTANNNFNVYTRVENKFALSIRPKIGYSFGDTMVHFAAGPTIGRFKYEWTFSDDANPAQASFSDNKNALGISSSIGVDHQIGGGWSLRGDYIFTYYPDIVDGSNRLSSPAGHTDRFTHDADFQSHSLRVGLIKHF